MFGLSLSDWISSELSRPIPESNEMKPVQSSFNATRKHLFGSECSAVHMLPL